MPVHFPPSDTHGIRAPGRGRNATVYECHGEDGQRLAFKFFNPNRRNIEEIRREIKILKRLRDHPNIITIIDEARPIRGPGHGIVMERVEHQDFRTLFPTLDMRDVCFYLKQLIGALAFAHSHSVMHRDIRPQNLVIDHMTKQVGLPSPLSSSRADRRSFALLAGARLTTTTPMSTTLPASASGRRPNSSWTWAITTSRSTYGPSAA